MRFALSAFHSNIYHCDFFEKQHSAVVAAAAAFVFYIPFLVCIFSICEKISARQRTKCSNEQIKILYICMPYR